MVASFKKVSPWKIKLSRSFFFMGAVFLHILLFVMLASFVIFKAVPPPPSDRFQAVSIPKSPPPPAPPPAAGGSAANALEPDLTVTPSETTISVISSAASAFNLKSTLSHAPNLPSALSLPKGTGLSGHAAGGTDAGPGNPFGSQSSSGAGDLVGYMYDLKQTFDQKPTGMTPDLYHAILRKFVESGWNESILAPYYKSPNPIYASQILIPDMDAGAGPLAFHLQNEVQPRMWIVWYRAKLSPPASGIYRFAGFCDDILLVRVDGQTVLDGSIFAVAPGMQRRLPWPNDWIDKNRVASENYGSLREGDPVNMIQGLTVDIDIIIGEEPGGQFNAALFSLLDGVDYPKDAGNEPELPLFQTGVEPVTHFDGLHPPINLKAELWTK